jgi:glycosyltransferase involved in cell wall biosynthesis
MRICLVGPGIMPIPPNGWGAVEILIWDIKTKLEELGHQVLIVNTRNRQEILDLCNSFNPDFVHVQYDEYWDICDRLNCDKVSITSHYGYIDQENRYDSYYRYIFQGFLSLKKTNIFSLSPSITQKYIQYGFSPSRIYTIPNGVRDDLFKFETECEFKDRSIFLAKIDPRKRQYLFHNITNLFFAGNISDHRYNGNNHLGEWSKEYLYNNLTRYSNLVLLSDGEAHPLVCLEAMSAGLGLVISEFSANNLDLSLPFIDVIPEYKISDIEYVQGVILNNREKSVSMRSDIRQYVQKNFTWDKIIKDIYIPAINKI